MRSTQGIKMYFVQGLASMFPPMERISACQKASTTFDEWYAHQNPAGWTIDQLLNEAWEKALPVKSGTLVHKGTRYIARTQEGWYTTGVFAANLYFDDSYAEAYRLCPPLPDDIPDDCNLVWSGIPGCRFVFHRDPSNPDRWNGYDTEGHSTNVHVNRLIDPKPILEEER